MPRTPGIRRYIFNTLAVVSLLLMLATAGLFVDGIWNHRQRLIYSRGTRSSNVHSYQGRVSIEFFKISPTSASAAHGTIKDWGMGSNYYDFSGRLIGRSLHLPHGLLLLLLGVLPAIWLIKWNKRRNLSPNACPNCDYDLTDNETGVCPECGAENGADSI
jgi:hypothetical protein